MEKFNLFPGVEAKSERTKHLGKDKEEYKIYDNRIYELVINAMREKGMLGKVKRKKIRHYKQLPAEAVFVFKKLEAKGIDINKLSDEEIKKSLDYSLGTIDRKDEYDKELTDKIGQMEMIRWRKGEKLKNPDSFTKIVETLKEHAVPERQKTLMEQQPRARLQPRGEYHKRQSLS